MSATASETLSEYVTVRAWSPKSCPATPSTNTIGTKTQIVVRVLATTAWPTSPAPLRAASTTPIPSSRRRWMASSTTIELSTRRPMPRVSPPSDMMLSERPETYIRRKEATTEIGIDTAMMAVDLKLRRKKARTRTARRPPTRAESMTSATDWRM